MGRGPDYRADEQIMTTTNHDMADYITIKEALYELKNKIGRSTLYKLMEKGELQKYRLGGRVFLNKNDVAGLMRRG